MLSGRNALIIAAIGAAIVVLYTCYLVLRLNCRLDTKIRPNAPGAGRCSASVQPEQPEPEQPEPEDPEAKPKPEPEPKPQKETHLAARCHLGVYKDYASELVKRLMKSAKHVTKDRAGAEKYYNALLREIYKKFVKLNGKILNKAELERSRKFLEEIRKEVKEYQDDLELEGGGIGGVSENDIAKVLNANEHAIYRVYPSLKA